MLNMQPKWFLAAILAGLLQATPDQSQTIYKPVDAALVLSMDVSGSVDESRWYLQREGMARAIRSDEFWNAIKDGMIGRISLSVVQWSDKPDLALPWMLIETREELNQFADLVQAMPRLSGGSTCVVNALQYSASYLESWRNYAQKLTIDLSGDGPENCISEPDKAVDQTRLTLVANGITINGLPIVTEAEPDLDQWYDKHVVGGKGAFLMPVQGFSQFEQAMKQKLIVEIS